MSSSQLIVVELISWNSSVQFPINTAKSNTDIHVDTRDLIKAYLILLAYVWKIIFFLLGILDSNE